MPNQEQELSSLDSLVAAETQLAALAQSIRLDQRIQTVQQTREVEGVKRRGSEPAYVEMVRRLTKASQLKDFETGEHVLRISQYARLLALETGSSPLDAELISLASPLHDLGKIGIPDRIIHKPGPLEPQEWEIMREHPRIGAQLLEGSHSPLIELGRQIALSHHERWDGSGYPLGMRGEQIPYAARIVAVCDCYDALRSKRSYKPSFPHEQSCAIILEGDRYTRPEHFDPKVLEAFRRVHADFARIFETIRESCLPGR